MFEDGRLQAIRDTGRPSGPRWRHVLPPVRVAVDLGAVFALPPHHAHAAVPDGLDLRGVVPARLSAWARSAQGDWFALVAYDAATADGSTHAGVSHWVPAHVVRPMDGPAEPAAPAAARPDRECAQLLAAGVASCLLRRPPS